MALLGPQPADQLPQVCGGVPVDLVAELTAQLTPALLSQQILESSPIEYKCYCSRDRVERALISMGVAELEDLLAEQGGCELGCQFCDKVYRFTDKELQAIIDQMKAQKKEKKEDE